jgi:DNA-directed RNA polymerase specialized sigma24 family protein
MAAPDQQFQDLLARVRNGVAEAARDLFTSCKDFLLRWIPRRIQYHPDRPALRSTESYVQDAFLAAWQALCKGMVFLNREAFVAYLRTTVRHKIAMDARRAHGPHLHWKDRVPLEGLPPDCLISREPSPEEFALVEDWLDQMDRLWPGVRRALEMKMRGWKKEDISDHLRINEKFLGRMILWLRRHGFPLPE